MSLIVDWADDAIDDLRNLPDWRLAEAVTMAVRRLADGVGFVLHLPIVGAPDEYRLLIGPRIARRDACVYNMRMPRIQVYLPDDLHRELKRAGLSPSELLQEAVRSELLRRQQIARLDEYLGELDQQVGKPSRANKTRADAIVRRMTRPRRTARRAS